MIPAAALATSARPPPAQQSMGPCPILCPVALDTIWTSPATQSPQRFWAVCPGSLLCRICRYASGYPVGGASPLGGKAVCGYRVPDLVAWVPEAGAAWQPAAAGGTQAVMLPGSGLGLAG